MAKRKSSQDDSAETGEGGPEAGLHPRKTRQLYGHEEAENTFLRAFQGGMLHHAWLLTGEQGIGKATFAYSAARFLLSQEAAGQSPHTIPEAHGTPAARQIAARAHSSLFVLDETATSTASIGVDEVRKLRSFLSLTSPTGWRAMIVDPANSLTIASANALLKAVEEPPPRTVFFLISHGAAAVMPTIRSRCVRLSFKPLSMQNFTSAVLAACETAQAEAPGAAALGTLYVLSAGSPGRALNFIIGGLFPLAEKLGKIFDGLPRMDFGLVHELIQAASGARNAQAFGRLCDLIETRIELMARQQLSQPAASAVWAKLWQTMRQRRLELEALNLDKGAFLLSVFSDMERAMRKPR